jgi:hypothetical protein
VGDLRSHICRRFSILGDHFFVSFPVHGGHWAVVVLEMALSLAACLVVAAAMVVGRKRSVRVYATLQSPAEHPLASRRAVTPPEYSDFGALGTMGLREFPQSVNGTIDMATTRLRLDQYTITNPLLTTVWPGYVSCTLPARHAHSRACRWRGILGVLVHSRKRYILACSFDLCPGTWTLELFRPGSA